MPSVHSPSTSRPSPEMEEALASIPVSLAPETAAAAARLVSIADAMGLVRLDEAHAIGGASLAATLDALGRVGIGSFHVAVREVATNLRGALDLLLDAVEHSPNPETEWQAVTEELGGELTARLVGISESSLRRYSGRERETPDEIALRLHQLALLNADLAGSYNRYGIRRWYSRPRRALDGQRPEDVLSGNWTPDDANVQAVASLARSLTTMAAT